MKGPSIAVMLGGKSEPDEGESSMGETKQRAEDAAHALAEALQAKDPQRIVRAFGALSTLVGKLGELEESGESEDEEKAEEDSGMTDGDEPVAKDANE